MPQPSERRIYRFGMYEADVRSGELRKNGVKLKIQGQPFEVLVALLERPGEVVTREELRQRLWPLDTFVDFDHSLNTAINKVRDLVGDSAANPRFLETLPKRGYRFIAPVQVDTDVVLSPIARDPVAPPAHAPALPAPVPAPLLPDRSVHVSSPLPEEHDLPRVNRAVGRALLAAIQFMYLCFYIAALWRLGSIDALGDRVVMGWGWLLMVVVVVSAVVGIPLRLYMMTAVLFDYRRLGENFRRIWPGALALDLVWALAPFLLVEQIGFGLAFGACAALLYVPFSQRTLLRMTYG